MLKTLNYSAQDDVSRYIRRAHEFPMLEVEVEHALARRWRDHADEAAARELASSYLRLVIKIAKGYLGYNLPFADLISEGNLGLMQAIHRFDPEQGFRLSTYAPWWIRAAIQDYVMRSESLVRMGTTAAQKKLFFNLKRLKARFHELDDGDLAPATVAAIAKLLGVTQDEVVEMNRRLVGGAHSLNATPAEGSETSLLDMLVDHDPDQEDRLGDAQEFALRRRLVSEAMETLSDRERHILAERRLKDDPPTLEELGQCYGVSRERIRQIEAQALEKIRKAVSAANANEPGSALAA
jgi:RNA polymerase sigma-32 factor